MGKWKKFFMKMPKNLQYSLDQMPSGSLVSVYTPKILSIDDIRKGVYEHLGISFENGDTYIASPTVIPEVTGKFSKYNVEDKEIKLTNLPMEEYTISFDAPNFGDESKGTHEVRWEKKRYQRSIIPAKGFAINIKAIEASKNLYEFEVNRNFKKDDDDLFYAINLLQESVGIVNIKVADEEIDYTEFEQVGWELFPPEERERLFKRVLSGKEVDRSKIDVYKERLDFLESLKPAEGYIYGTTGLGAYLGARIREDIVAFENLRYGNAIYIMFEDWEVLSRLSRTELLKRPSLNYQRVRHVGNWKNKVRGVIRVKIESK